MLVLVLVSFLRPLLMSLPVLVLVPVRGVSGGDGDRAGVGGVGDAAVTTAAAAAAAAAADADAAAATSPPPPPPPPPPQFNSIPLALVWVHNCADISILLIYQVSNDPSCGRIQDQVCPIVAERQINST